MKKVVVVGGGFAGLTTAYYLVRAGFQVSLHEKSGRLGGLLGTHQFSWGMAETGANALLSHRLVEELFTDLNLKVLPARSTSKGRFIYRGGMRKWPLSFLCTLKSLPSFISLIRGRNAVKPQAFESLDTWAKRCFGDEVAEFLVATGQQGIYAGDPGELSASLLTAPLFSPQSRPPKGRWRGSIAPEDGMHGLVLALQRSLMKGPTNIYMNSAVENIEPVPHVICTDAHSAADILQAVSPRVADRLRKVEYLPLISVTVGHKGAKIPKGFGCLFPRSEGVQALGVLWNQNIFSGRATDQSSTWIYGGALHRDVNQLSDKEVKAMVLADHQKLDFGGEILGFSLSRWDQAVPHYSIGLEKELSSIEKMGGIWLNGNYLGSLGLSRILLRSAKIAEEISRMGKA